MNYMVVRYVDNMWGAGQEQVHMVWIGNYIPQYSVFRQYLSMIKLPGAKSSY